MKLKYNSLSYVACICEQDLGSQFNHFILADAPTFNTIKDFWCMIWSQKSKYVVSLSTAEEVSRFDNSHVTFFYIRFEIGFGNFQTQNQFFPKQLNVDTTFGEYTVTVLTEQNLSHTIERTVKVTSPDSNETHHIVTLQAKVWPIKT